MAKGVMPAISQTEKVALGCGTIGFDCHILTGSPFLQHLVDTYDPKLSEEELSFLDNEVNELFNLLNDHDISTSTKNFRNIWETKDFLLWRHEKSGAGKSFLPMQFL